QCPQPARLAAGRTGHGHLDRTGPGLATDQGSLTPDHADRSLEHAPASGSRLGPDAAAVARQRFRQDETAIAETGDAQLPGPGAAPTRGVAVAGGGEAGGGASGGTAAAAGVAARREFPSSGPAWGDVGLCRGVEQ